MAFPGFDRFYELTNPQSPSAFIGSMELSFHDSAAAFTGEIAPNWPVRVVWEMGRKTPKDFVWTTCVIPLIVSDKVIKILQGQYATGWSTYDVRLVGAEGEEIPGYKGLVVIGRCGPVQRERSIPVPKQLPGGVFPVARGYFFDEASWDGSDMFLASGTDLVFVTDRTMQALQKARVTGVRFVRADLAERLEL